MPLPLNAAPTALLLHMKNKAKIFYNYKKVNIRCNHWIQICFTCNRGSGV